jgi:signal transduction histidine kinase/CheY-like chemotaxis protein/HPt (histidine-containing phosphotransfer) domain-containing protein
LETIRKRLEGQDFTERLVLFLYSVYNINFLIKAIRLHWVQWVPIVLLAVCGFAWGQNIGKVRDYRFRAMFTTGMMSISFVLYGIYCENISSVLITYIVFVAFVGLYGLLEPGWILNSTFAFILLYHGFVLNSFECDTFSQTMEIVVQIVNILVVESVFYFWIKDRNNGNKGMLEVIMQLRTAQQSKDDFLANVSHEIRTPINTICGMSELMLYENDPDKMKEMVLNIQNSGRNLMTVVSDILDFSELQSGEMELVEEAYNITSTINDVINMTMAMKNDRQIRFMVNCDADLPCSMLGDEKKIRRVIMNLLSNATKFTNEGSVMLDISHRREEYGTNLVITVADTGIGMKEESLEQLFTSFNQVDTSRNRQEGGIGLGLAISKLIVDKMGGVISVKSRIGEGTMIKVVIPQKVLDETPIIHVNNSEEINAALYINMEKMGMKNVRDRFAGNIRRIMSQLHVRYHMCRSLSELKRLYENEEFSHVFISLVEYMEDKEYFDGLSEKTNLVLIVDRTDEKYIDNNDIRRIYKPFFALPVANVLNGEIKKGNRTGEHATSKFYAPRAHVLVVDDNVMNIHVIKGLLEKYKIKVTAAESGAEALEKIETMDYDFVFMDHMMPEMDGIETMHRIRSKPGSYYKNVPILALTANAIAGMREMFLKEGFNDFVEKPVEISVLDRVLRRTLPPEKIVKASDDITDETPKTAPDEIAVGDLDVEKGIIYCGGKDEYMDILRLHADEDEADREYINRLLKEENWKDYTIAVHAVKSSMKSIGAEKLSEMARNLEKAGKDGSTEYILSHHEAFDSEYERLISMLKEYCSKNAGTAAKTEEEELDLSEIDEDAFDKKIIEIEDSMYAFDGERMKDVLNELEKYKYHGEALKPHLEPLIRKVEKSDYIAAVEALMRLKDGIKKPEVERDV